MIEEAVKYLEKCRTPEGGIQYSLGSGGGPRLPISAAAVATLYNAGQFDSPIATDCLKYVWDQFRANEGWNKGGGHAFYTHLYASQGFYMAGDEYWDNYFPADPRPVDRHAGAATARGTATGSARSTAPRSPSSSCSFRSSIFRSSSAEREGRDLEHHDRQSSTSPSWTSCARPTSRSASRSPGRSSARTRSSISS